MRTILLNRVSWGAVLSGVVVALVAHLILNMIGIGVGASTLEPAAGAAANPSPATFSIGAGVWWTVSGIIAALAGGYAAGRLAGKPKESTAAWHGLVAWALTTLVIFYLLTSTVGSLVGGAFRTVATAAGGISSTTAAAVQTAVNNAPDPFSSIEQSLRSATGGNDPATLRDASIAAMRAAVSGDPGQVADARQRAVDAIAKAQNVSPEQARAQVQKYEEQYRETVESAKQKAAQTAETAAKAVSRGALFGSLALLLGALAGWFGGRMGAVDPTLTARFARRQS